MQWTDWIGVHCRGWRLTTIFWCEEFLRIICFMTSKHHELFVFWMQKHLSLALLKKIWYFDLYLLPWFFEPFKHIEVWFALSYLFLCILGWGTPLIYLGLYLSTQGFLCCSRGCHSIHSGPRTCVFQEECLYLIIKIVTSLSNRCSSVSNINTQHSYTKYFYQLGYLIN